MIVSRSCVKVEVIGSRSRSPRQKYNFHGFCIVYWANDLQVKGLEGKGQRSHGSRSKVTWVKVKGRLPKENICNSLNIYQKVEGYRIKVKGHKVLSQVMVPNKVGSHQHQVASLFFNGRCRKVSAWFSRP